MRAKMRKELLGKQTPTQVLLSKNKGAAYNDTLFRFKQQKVCLTDYFSTFRESQALFRRLSNLLLIDTTYKTNRFKLSLMHVMGTTCLNHTLTITFYFIVKETRASYQ